MDFKELLESEWTRRIAPHDAKSAEIDRELKEVTDASYEQMLQAQIRVLERSFDELLARGETTEEARSEIGKLKETLRERAETRQRLQEERQAQADRRVLIGERILAELFPQIRQECLKQAEVYLKGLEQAWEALQWLEGVSRCRLSLSLHQNSLVPKPWAETRELERKLRKWIG